MAFDFIRFIKKQDNNSVRPEHNNKQPKAVISRFLKNCRLIKRKKSGINTDSVEK